jgi:hypothetical protein
MCRITEDEKQALSELENFLDNRLRKAKTGKISKRKVGDIFKEAYQKTNGQANS